MVQNLESRSGREFRVGIEGIELPPETVDRITHAIQKAVLTELAGMDLAVGFETRFANVGGSPHAAAISGGATRGMQITAR